jgi:hypothetical protein
MVQLERELKQILNIAIGGALICISAWIGLKSTKASCTTAYYVYNEAVMGLGLFLLIRGLYHEPQSYNVGIMEDVIRGSIGVFLIVAAVALKTDHTTSLVRKITDSKTGNPNPTDSKTELKCPSEEAKTPINALLWLGVGITGLQGVFTVTDLWKKTE